MTSLTKQLRQWELALAKTGTFLNSREYFATLRDVLHAYEEVVRGREDSGLAVDKETHARLCALAKRAFLELGGQPEPSPLTLDLYDHDRYGPMLGVSDEGSAAKAIRKAAWASPKAAVLGDRDPMKIGMALDAERLGAVGEVAVGPDEYVDVRLGCLGRLLCTTNVGTRVNLRHYLPPPVVTLPRSSVREAVDSTCRKLACEFKPFWKPSGRRSRAVTVFVKIDTSKPRRDRERSLADVQRAVDAGTFCAGGRTHRLGLLAVCKGKSSDRKRAAIQAINLASKCGITEVSLDGTPLPAARDSISYPGLSNYFEPTDLSGVLAHAARCRVKVMPKNRVDPQTTARHVWTGLAMARNMGLQLGKYGLFPLTLNEQKEVIVRIQQWFTNWCAAPVCYIDYPMVAEAEVYHGRNLARGIERWLEMVAQHGVRVVLIDTAKKSDGRRLLKDGPRDDRGMLLLDEVRRLDAYARTLGIKALWAGGISLPQTFELGRLGVFGVYVTSAVATEVPLGRHYRRDPALATLREPDAEAVGQVKLLLEAGFLVGQLQTRGQNELADELETAARTLINDLANKNNQEIKKQEEVLHRITVQAWKTHLRLSA